MKCDGCNRTVTGVKYKCLQCKDIVFCVHCERGGIHNQHTTVEATSDINVRSINLPLFSLGAAIKLSAVAAIVSPTAIEAMSPPHATDASQPPESRDRQGSLGDVRISKWPHRMSTTSLPYEIECPSIPNLPYGIVPVAPPIVHSSTIPSFLDTQPNSQPAAKQRGSPETEKELWTLEPVKTRDLPPVPPRTSRTPFESYESDVDSEIDLYTVKWVPAKSSIAYRRTELSDVDPEFQAVKQNIGQLGGKNFTNKVIKICRIENFRLYKTYKSCREYMTGVNDPGTINERTLWHGTSVDVLGNIYRDGFNRSYCGRNATAFGNGVYFATSFDYSASPKYSPPDAKGQKYVFQCRVLTGHFTKGEQELKEPPMRTPEFRYDSVVDDISAPAMFVVFKDMQVYPEYVITLKL